MTSSSFSSPPQSSPARGEIVDPESASETKESSHITRRPMTPARRKRIIRDALLFFVLIAPNLTAILVFSYYPATYNILLSFMDWDLVAPYPEWVALENYVGLFTDIEFWQIMMNTLIFTGVTVVGSLVGGITLGTLLRSEEHTSELQSRGHLVCRLLLEKKKT